MSQKRESFSYPRNVSFRCARCALCCGDTKARARHILLLPVEAQAISKAVQKPIESFATGVKHRQPYAYEMKKTPRESKCVFLYGTDCYIYELRPLVCRFYPFRLTTAKHRKHRFLCTTECRGISTGRMLDAGYFEDLLEHARSLIKTRKVHSEK